MRSIFIIFYFIYCRILFLGDTCDFCNCECCDNCFNGDEKSVKEGNSEKITEEDIFKAEENYKYPEEIEITTQKILIHLKLDNGELNDIANEINNIQDNEEKIKKIIEYSKDIDWENECCPNTLIRWENNECAYIAYFHLMLNNPYFLKFFWICDKTMRREDTYILNAICECVKWCIDHPRFEGTYRGSVDKIMRAFFRKDSDNEYFYLKKEFSFFEKKQMNKKNSFLAMYYYGLKDSTGKKWAIPPHSYGGFQGKIWDRLPRCLLYDLKIEESDIEEKFLKIFPEEDDERGLNKENISKIFSSKEEEQLPILKKLLGVCLSQYEWHTFSLINNNGIWYNKNTLQEEQCKKMTVHEVLRLFNEILKIKKPIKKEFYKGQCYILFIKKNQDSL